jgi:uncharacterized MAPEG superfamily protein
VTVALWCVFLTAWLPVLTTGLAKIGSPFDNHNPREFMQRIAGFRRRAYDAHLNGFEGFPFFAAAVIVAQMQAAPQTAVDNLSIVYVLTRLAYTGAYIADLATLRSIFWSIGFFTVSAIFLSKIWA